MRIVVTGSAGLVGKALCESYVPLGHEVIGIDRRLKDGEAMDFRDPRCRDLLDDSIDGVVHLAAVSRVAWGEADPDLCEAINVDGTQLLLDWVHKAAPRAWFLFASSREVYGNPERPIVREDDPLLPVNHYGRSKLEGEKLVARARATGMATATVRLCNVYGGREDHADRAVPSLVHRALRNETLTLTGADCYFDFVHVRDVVAGLVRLTDLLGAGKRDMPTIHLATGRKTTLGDLAALAIDVSGGTSTIDEVQARSFDVSGFCGAPELSAQVIGWWARVPLREGLKGVSDDIRLNGPLIPFPMSALQGCSL